MSLILWLSVAVFICCVHASAEICSICNCKGGIVDCSKQGLENHFNDSSWSGIIQVDSIVLDFNKIIHLKAFPLLGTTKLSIRHNYITKIDDAAFRFVTNLTELDLSYNHLTSAAFSPHIFKGNYSPQYYQPLNITILRLSGNMIHSLRNDIFEHLPNLRVLSIDSNPLKTIDTSTAIAISSIYHLEVLDISSAQLKSLPPTMLHGPMYLKVLNLSNNFFTDVPNTLGEVHSLEELVLDDNPISEIKSFPEIPTLKILKMNWMLALRKIANNSLSGLINLEELHCSHNRLLSSISENALMHRPLGNEETPTWPPLRKLLLHHNDLSYLDVNLLSRWDKLEYIDIQMNPWICDCNNQWMLTTLIPRINQTNSSLLFGIECNKPVEMEGQLLYQLSERSSHMRCLDLYGNQPDRDDVILIVVVILVFAIMPIVMAFIVFVLYKNVKNNYHHTSYKNLQNS
ncbi:unnamed protein product [Nezara viridula]|uniref:Uncharacterized protein n=1 Tax=Nezara viridula TaxID=85310 RepID=A0A9P0E8H7_NEZVI|nr:unnamed protein product [Nezara viridula]